LRGFTSKGKGGVQGRGGSRVGIGKKEGRERGKRRNKGGKGEGKKGSGKGILAIPILVCFRRRCMCQGLVECHSVNSENGVRKKRKNPSDT